MAIASWRDLIGNAFHDAKFYVPASAREIGPPGASRRSLAGAIVAWVGGVLER